MTFSADQIADMHAVSTRLTLGAGEALAVGGPVWTIYRTSAGTPSQDGVTATAGSVTAYVDRNDKRKFQQAAAGPGLWDADWLVYAVAGVDIRNGDVLSDGARAFLIIGTPDLDLGTLLAPAEMTGLPS